MVFTSTEGENLWNLNAIKSMCNVDNLRVSRDIVPLFNMQIESVYLSFILLLIVIQQYMRAFDIVHVFVKLSVCVQRKLSNDLYN